jgi:hypothetical protein
VQLWCCDVGIACCTSTVVHMLILGTDSAVNFTGMCCVVLLGGLMCSCNVVTLVLLVVHRCCTHVAGNPWRCDCDAIYTVYRTSRNATRKNLTLLCENPEDVSGASWDILEDKCRSTVMPPRPPTLRTVTSSAVNTTRVSRAQFSTNDQHGVSDQQSSPDPSHSVSARLVIPLSMFAVAVYTVVLALIVTTRQRRVTCGNDSDRRLCWLV